MVKSEPDVKSNIDAKPNIELKHDVKVVRTKPDMNEIIIKPSLDRRSMELSNCEEEKVALILGTTAVFTVWWMFSKNSHLGHNVTWHISSSLGID